jgi:hypothetical protein
MCGLVIDRDHDGSKNILHKLLKPWDDKAESFQKPLPCWHGVHDKIPIPVTPSIPKSYIQGNVSISC